MWNCWIWHPEEKDEKKKGLSWKTKQCKPKKFILQEHNINLLLRKGNPKFFHPEK